LYPSWLKRILEIEEGITVTHWVTLKMSIIRCVKKWLRRRSKNLYKMRRIGHKCKTIDGGEGTRLHEDIGKL